MYFTYVQEINPSLSACYLVEREEKTLIGMNFIKNKELITDNSDEVEIDEVIIPNEFFDSKIDKDTVKIKKVSEFFMINIGHVHIKRVVLSEGYETLASRAFSDNRNYIIDEIILPESVRRISHTCFGWNRAISKVVLPKKLLSIGKNAFYQSTIKGVEIPDSCSTINDSAFSYSNIEYIKFGKKMKKIEHQAFEGCYALKKIDWPDLVTEVPIKCFFACKNLSNVNFNSNITYVGAYAFADTNIKVLDFSKSATCPKLTKYDYPVNTTVKFPYYSTKT